MRRGEQACALGVCVRGKWTFPEHSSLLRLSCGAPGKWKWDSRVQTSVQGGYNGRAWFSHAVSSLFGGGDGAPFDVVIVLCSPAEPSDLFPFALETDVKCFCVRAFEKASATAR